MGLINEIVQSKEWIKLIKKHKIVNVTVPKAAKLPTYTEYFGEKFEGAFVAFKEKGKRRYYPGLIALTACVENKIVLSIFTPLGGINGVKWDVFPCIEDIVIKLL
eukprot:330428_1